MPVVACAKSLNQMTAAGSGAGPIDQLLKLLNTERQDENLSALAHLSMFEPLERHSEITRSEKAERKGAL